MSNQVKKKRNHVGVCRDGKPFDDALRSLSIHCKKWVLPVLNKAFGTDFALDEQIWPIENKNIVFPVFGAARRNPHLRESQFLVKGSDGKEHLYQLECLADNDWTVAFTRDFGGIVGPKTTIEFLETVVLSLRINDNTPDEYEIEVASPDASESWGVPVIKIPNYTLEELAAKRLYLLLPFHIFRFENKLAEMKDDAEKRNSLITAFESINQLLSELVGTGEMSQQEATCIRKCSWKVANGLLEGYADIRRDVKRIIEAKNQRN